MKYKMLYGILIFCVSVMMLMPNVLASGGPPIWLNQATLSTVDDFPSQDPENSGFGPLQVTVWEEWNGGDWDIYMKYSLLDGAPGSWFFPPAHPAITAVDEINPAVSVTRNHPTTGQEIHVVYQRWNIELGGFWEIMHTYAAFPGLAWIGPVAISTVGVDSTNPAIVYTEDQSLNPVGGPPFVVQVVWEEALVGGGTQIMYRAHYYDFNWVPVRNYLPRIIAPPFLIMTPLIRGGSCELPEIASTDERLTILVFDFDFNIVWQEFDPIFGNWNIWYVDGTTTTSVLPPPPPPQTIALNLPAGRLNARIPGVDHTDPDIAASQDYLPLGGPGAQSYYFHVDWVKQTPGPPVTFDVDQSYFYGPTPTPGSAAFSPPASVLVPPIPPAVILDNPTIATKLTSVPGALGAITFETWFAWENTPATDIWYNMGTYTSAPPVFALWAGGPIRVPYTPIPGVSIEQNPELWNREDVLRPNPPLTHLVFDRDPDPVGGSIEVVYIDP